MNLNIILCSIFALAGSALCMGMERMGSQEFTPRNSRTGMQPLVDTRLSGQRFDSLKQLAAIAAEQHEIIKAQIQEPIPVRPHVPTPLIVNNHEESSVFINMQALNALEPHLQIIASLNRTEGEAIAWYTIQPGHPNYESLQNLLRRSLKK